MTQPPAKVVEVGPRDVDAGAFDGFTPRQPPEPDLARYTAQGITTEAYRYRCRLNVMAPAQVVRAHIAPTIGVVTPPDQDTCELGTGSNSLKEVALYVGLIGHELVVHDRPELRELLAKLGSRLSRAACHPRPGRGT